MARFIKVHVGENTGTSDYWLVPGKNVYTGVKPFIEEFGDVISIEEDLLNLASGIYATDLLVKRDLRQNYIRNIDLSIEVVNIHALKLVKPEIEKALFVLSRDNWKITFIPKEGQATSKLKWDDKPGNVLLFSGGLDSMAGAADLTSRGEDVILVSHNTQGNTAVDNCQKSVHSALESYFKRDIKHVHLKVYTRTSKDYPFPEDRENTQRTRSFLFLILATLVTRRSGFNRVLFMAENGQFAIHLPLNQARIGPFSTHTADPTFLAVMQDLLGTLLLNPAFEITNPYQYKTKADVVACIPAGLLKKSFLSGSCWMLSRIQDNKHCGYCIPCISRRIALETNKISFDEYAFDVFNHDISALHDTDDKKRNIIDYIEFVSQFRNLNGLKRQEIVWEFPELISEHIDLEAAIKMYEAVAKQSYSVFQKYPKLKKIVK